MYPIHPSLSDHTQVQVQNSLSQGAELMSARGDVIELGLKCNFKAEKVLAVVIFNHCYFHHMVQQPH